jgi:uncharacterized membrane-anchored protein YitT (DUF2179 family)
MSRFIKLSKIIINPNSIQIIIRNENELIINLTTNKTTGTFFGGSGGFSNESEQIKICKEEDADDYDKLINWIENEL